MYKFMDNKNKVDTMKEADAAFLSMSRNTRKLRRLVSGYHDSAKNNMCTHDPFWGAVLQLRVDTFPSDDVYKWEKLDLVEESCGYLDGLAYVRGQDAGIFQAHLYQAIYYRDPVYQEMVAEHYTKGSGVKINYTRAIYWLEMAYRYGCEINLNRLDMYSRNARTVNNDSDS